jgi:hypothetical protein
MGDSGPVRGRITPTLMGCPLAVVLGLAAAEAEAEADAAALEAGETGGAALALAGLAGAGGELETGAAAPPQAVSSAVNTKGANHFIVRLAPYIPYSRLALSCNTLSITRAETSSRSRRRWTIRGCADGSPRSPPPPWWPQSEKANRLSSPTYLTR